MSANCWVPLILSTGRWRSLNPAITRHHFIIGAQKWTVFGPAGAFRNRDSTDEFVDIWFVTHEARVGWAGISVGKAKLACAYSMTRNAAIG